VTGTTASEGAAAAGGAEAGQQQQQQGGSQEGDVSLPVPAEAVTEVGGWMWGGGLCVALYGSGVWQRPLADLQAKL
jgi:hypothetical protein